MNDSKDNNKTSRVTTNNETVFPEHHTGRILPFRKPKGPHPTLGRRPSDPKHRQRPAQSGRLPQSRTPRNAAKGDLSARSGAQGMTKARFVQMALLALAFLLALKNCGKI